MKNKTNSSRRPPRILLLGPPCSGKCEIAQIIAKKYGICNISLSELLIKEVGNKNDSSLQILEAMNQGELVNDKYVTKVLEERLSASDAMINGWILTGYPKTSSQITHIKSSKLLNPTKVIFLYLDDEVIGKRSEQRRLDPISGKIYYLDQINKTAIPKEILDRLVVKEEDKPKVFQKRYKAIN